MDFATLSPLNLQKDELTVVILKKQLQGIVVALLLTIQAQKLIVVFLVFQFLQLQIKSFGLEQMMVMYNGAMMEEKLGQMFVIIFQKYRKELG